MRPEQPYLPVMASYLAITPSDSANLPQPVRTVYLGAAGDVTVTGVRADDVSTTFKALPQGWFAFPFPIAKIAATGTTATGIVGAP